MAIRNNVTIEQIRPQLTWRLRNEVLYPNEPLHAMAMDEDNQGLHFGAFTADKLVGVISLFQKANDFQFRKFAISSAFQNQGIGALMLQYITEFAQLQGGTRLWCNARLSAVNFYQKAGFRTTGNTFTRNNITFEVFEKEL
ncbi:GNAT family N-acetyltransferase [Mucilaginibacter lacusdianchii]|uniref:GNAT family N-acetyltransferase n=1 Tax=Mucilaginibacter lacusdianchii TaxID=2684211 RepID=UPI00131E0D24|nr:GNAT family N-acetyltransferase [Mucilaginibacter sp. JXJ CY 39]